MATLPVASTLTVPGTETHPPGLLTSQNSIELVVIVDRFIGWLKTKVKMVLMGTPPAFTPGLMERSVGEGTVTG